MLPPLPDTPTRCPCGGALATCAAPPGLAALRCAACGYLRTRYAGAQPARIELQDGAHPSAFQAGGAARFSPGIGAIRQWCARYRVRASLVGRGAAGRAALDFGCGQGYYLDALRAAGWRALGVEISATTARQAAARGHPVCHSLDELPERPVDALVSIHVIEHLPDAAAMLGRLGALTRPGAAFHIEVPNGASWQARLFGWRWLHREAGLHVHHFTAASLVALLAGEGFRVRRLATWSFEHGYFGWVQSLLNLIFPYNRFFRLFVLNRPWRDKLRVWPELLALPLALALAVPAFAAESLAGRGAVLRAEGVYRPEEP